MSENTLSVESFIEYCEPAQEGVLKSIKNAIIDIFLKLINKIEGLIRKMKDSKVKSALSGLLGRAKRGLQKARGMKPDYTSTGESLKKESNQINEELTKTVKGYKLKKYQAIEDGIAKGDVKALREAVGSICYVRRDFSSGEFDEAVNYVSAKVPGFMDSSLVGSPTVSSQKTSFTDDDFARAVFELKKNFCQERIADVKKIGKALYSK